MTPFRCTPAPPSLIIRSSTEAYSLEPFAMLVLTRKAGQKIQIGPHTTVHVVKIEGRRVTLGFESPEDVRRGEAPERLEAEPCAQSD